MRVAVRVVPAFQRGRRGAEQDGNAELLGAADGDIAAMIPRGGVLFVGGVVLLIDDDQPEVRRRREDGAARADDDLGPAGGDRVPVQMPVRILQAAVQHGDTLETLGEPLDGLRRQGDFGDQHDGALARTDNALDGADVDLGLARAGDTVDEADAEFPFVQQAVDVVESVPLVFGEHEFARLDRARGDVGGLHVGPVNAMLNPDEPLLGEASEHRFANTGPRQRGGFRLRPGAEQVGEDFHRLAGAGRKLHGRAGVRRRRGAEVNEHVHRHPRGFLYRRGNHRAQRDADGRAVILGDPAGQVEQVGGDRKDLTHDFGDIL